MRLKIVEDYEKLLEETELYQKELEELKPYKEKYESLEKMHNKVIRELEETKLLLAAKVGIDNRKV